MIKGAGGKSPGSMAVATILVTGHAGIVRIGWHVRIEKCGKWFACGSNLRCYRAVIAMARLTVVSDTGMIEAERWREVFGVMTRTTIGSGSNMRGYSR